MHWLDPMQPSLLVSLPVGFAAKSAVAGWLAWTMWRREGPHTILGRSLRGFYAWITLTSIALTFVLGRLAWNAHDNDLTVLWLTVVLILDVTSIMTAWWGWRVRGAYLELAHLVDEAVNVRQDIREDKQNTHEIELSARSDRLDARTVEQNRREERQAERDG